MICKNCGNEINDNVNMCPYCDISPKIQYNKEEIDPRDNPGCGTMIISFLVPIVGIILWIAWKRSAPKSSKLAIKCALIRIGINAILVVIGIISRLII